MATHLPNGVSAYAWTAASVFVSVARCSSSVMQILHIYVFDLLISGFRESSFVEETSALMHLGEEHLNLNVEQALTPLPTSSCSRSRSHGLGS